MIERYWGQNFVESIGSILLLIGIIVGVGILALWEPDPIAAAVAPNNTTVIIPVLNMTERVPNLTARIPNITVTIPDYFPVKENYQDWKYRNKQYNFSEWFTFSRANVSGDKDLRVSTTVYRIKTEPNVYTWEVWSGGPVDGSADWANVPDPGKQFLFVWVCEYMDGTDPVNDPSMWGMDQDHFYVQARGKIYENTMSSFDLTTPIREFENIWDLAGVVRTSPYGYYFTQDQPSGRIHVWPQSYLRMGRSNAWDGWIMYQIPNGIRPEEVQVIGRFENIGGYAFWTVKPGGGYSK